MSAHTPAPWRRRTFKADAGEVLDANGNWVARVHRRNSDEDDGAECFANTCLISAAPELLEALEMLADAERDRIADGGQGFMTTIARAKVSMALTKARGV